MRKLLSLTLAVLMLFSCCICVTADSTSLFAGMKILPELMDRADSDYVRRDEFAAVAAALMGFTAAEPSSAPFTDVAENNAYGSSIRIVKEAGVMNGVNNEEFAPADTVTFQNAIVTFVRILGYQSWADMKGGYPGGYNQVATALKLFKEISRPLDSMLTFGDLWTLTDWILETPKPESDFYMKDGELTEAVSVSKDAPTLLEKNFGLTKYKAFVNEVIGETNSINVTITKENKKDDNKYEKGETLLLEAAATVNIAAFDKAPVYIWVNDNDELVHMAMQDGCEVIYGVVYSVNRDDTKGAYYNTSNITELTFLDNEEEYEASDDGIAFYQNDKAVSGSICLTDKYVRAVVKDNEITAVETWDFKPGGIVSEITFKSIVYKRGDITEAVNDIDRYDKQILIIDGEMRDIKELKVDTLVDYYISADKKSFILLASEKKYTDVFETVAESEMQLGNMLVSLADTVYTNVEGKGFKEGHVSELLGNRVSAYVDAFGKVRYITTADGVTKDNFIGYLIGVKEGSGLRAEKEIYVANLDDPNFAKKVYKLSDKVVYEDDLSFGALEDGKDTKTAKSIYRFKFNAKDEIVKVSKLNPYYGYDKDAEGFVSLRRTGEFPSTGDPAYMAIGGKRIYFPEKHPMVALYEENGEAAFGTICYDDMTGQTTTNGVTFYFFGEEMSSEYDLILVSGDLSTFRKSGSTQYGIVDSVSTGLDSEGEEIKIIDIEGKKYRVSKAAAEGVKENTFISYSVTTGNFSQEQIYIHDKVQLEGDMLGWLDNQGSAMEMHLGTVAKIDSSRLYLEDGEAFFFYPSGCTYRAYDEASEKFSQGSANDFLQGKDVIYILNKSTKVVVTIFYLA